MVMKSRQKKSNSPLEPSMPNRMKAALFGLSIWRALWPAAVYAGFPEGPLHSDALSSRVRPSVRPKASRVWGCRSTQVKQAPSPTQLHQALAYPPT